MLSFTNPLARSGFRWSGCVCFHNPSASRRDGYLLTDAVFAAPTMSPPAKRTQWRENLQNFRRDHGFSKKVLLDCCLVRRVIAWAAPTAKGRNATGSPLQDASSCAGVWLDRR